MPFSSSSVPRLGAQLFINREDTSAQVRAHVAALAGAGLRLARLFVFWDQVNPAPEVWRWDTYDAAFDAAAEHGVGIVPTLFTQCPPGWMRLTMQNQSVGDLEDPALRASARDYLERVVTRWRAHPALDSWIAWNEPSVNVPRTPATLGLFRAWLTARHGGDIARYNRNYYRQFAAFEEIDFEPLGQLSPIASRMETGDWLAFTIDYLTGLLRDLAADIRALDTAHPVHLNPHLVLEARAYGGAQSLWREAEGGAAADFLGCSIHPVWHCTRFPAARRGVAVGMINDLIRSATPAPEAHYWVSELQGGPAIFSGFEAGTPTPEDLRSWLWESLGAGARAVVFWSLNARTDGGEGGEWALLDQRGRPSRRLRAVAEVAAALEARAGLFGPARPARPAVRILHSEASWRLAFLEGQGDERENPRNREAASDAMAGAYELLTGLGHEVGFVDEPTLARDASWMEGTRVLVLPGCTALEAGTPAALEAFVAGGGLVIADGLCGWKTPDGWIATPAAAGALALVLGAEMADIEAHPGRLALELAEGGELPAWFSRVALEPGAGAAVLARWDDGAPAATCATRAGRLAALRIGTAFFQRYFVQPDPSAAAWLGRWVAERTRPEFRVVGGPAGARLRRLAHPLGSVLVLIVPGGADEDCRVVAERPGTWRAGPDETPGAATREWLARPGREGVVCVLFTPASES